MSRWFNVQPWDIEKLTRDELAYYEARLEETKPGLPLGGQWDVVFKRG